MKKNRLVLLFFMGITLILMIGCYYPVMCAIGYFGQYPVTSRFIQDDRIIGLWEGEFNTSIGRSHLKYEIRKKDDYYELIDKEQGDDKDKHIGYIYLSKIGSMRFLNIYTNIKTKYAPYNYAKYIFDNQGKCIINFIDPDYTDENEDKLRSKTFISPDIFQSYVSGNCTKGNFFDGRNFVFTKNTNPRRGKDRAIFFTAYDYVESTWQPLPDIPKEVNLLVNSLQILYDFDVEIVPNATHDKIMKTLKLYDNKQLYSTDSQLLIFFSMHGKPGYLIPSDGGATVTSGTWLAHTELRDIINALPCPRIMLSIDACYSGTFGANRSGPQGASWEIDNWDCKVKCERVFSNKNLTRRYITAGQAEDRVPTESKFAARWYKALKSEGGEDGLLSFAELWATLDQIDIIRPTNGNFGSGQDKGDFVFVCKSCCTSQ